MSRVIAIESDDKYGPEIAKAGKKLIVVDFMALWCGPCRNISPAYEQFAVKYPNAVLLKVDVDKCPETSQMNNVSAMPTFILFRNSKKVDTQLGADINALEEKIKKWYSDEFVEGGDTDVGVKGCVDLSSLINKSASECLNESDDHPLIGALTSKEGFLESDCDEQLIISITFSQAVKLHSLKLQGPADQGPKNVKLFINLPNIITFDQASSMAATQDIQLSLNDIKEDSVIPLRFVKFQNIQNLTFFIADNQSGGDVTKINYIGFIGSPVASSTNMAEFKRVSGKVGESHS